MKELKESHDMLEFRQQSRQEEEWSEMKPERSMGQATHSFPGDVQD